MTEPTYVPASYPDDEEYARLRAMEAGDDPETLQTFARIGIDPARLTAPAEVGVGAGGIAGWMARAVGDAGRVTVVDIDPRFVDRLEAANLDVVVANIVETPLEPIHDLVHCRYVVQHVTDPWRAIANLAAGLAPGGWLVVEDSHWGSTVCDDHHQAAPLYRRVSAVLVETARLLGVDVSVGARLPAMVDELGLEQRGQRIWQYFELGDTSSGARAAAAERLGPIAVDRQLLTEEDLAAYRACLADPSFVTLSESTASVWGRRAS